MPSQLISTWQHLQLHCSVIQQHSSRDCVLVLVLVLLLSNLQQQQQQQEQQLVMVLPQPKPQMAAFQVRCVAHAL